MPKNSRAPIRKSKASRQNISTKGGEQRNDIGTAPKKPSQKRRERFCTPIEISGLMGTEWA